MLQAINSYTLDTAILDYPEDSFIEIHEATYDFYESFFGIKRMFKDEKFYYAQNDTFLGRKATTTNLYLGRNRSDVSDKNGTSGNLCKL